MNSFAVKLIWFGACGLAGGAITLTLINEHPAAAWQGPIMLTLGCILVFIGARNLYDENDDAVSPRATAGSHEATTELARLRSDYVVENMPGSKEEIRPERARSNVARPAIATVAIVLCFVVALCAKVFWKSVEERNKQKSAVPQRCVLGTLSPGAFDAEDFLMSAAEIPVAEQQLIRTARELLKDEDYQAAIDCLNAPQEKNAWFAARLFYLGYALQQLDRNQEAIDVLSSFIELQGKTDAYSIYRRNSRYYRAKAFIALGRIPDAVSDLTAAIEIAPAAELHELRAEAFKKLGNADAAQRDRRRAAKLDPVSASFR